MSIATTRADASATAGARAPLPDRIHAVYDEHARRAPERAALAEGKTVWTYAQLADRVEATASNLADIGVRRGDRVVLVSENSISLACLLFACSRLGAWGIVANPRLSPRELDQIREHSGCRITLFTADVSAEAAAHAARCGAVSLVLSALTGVMGTAYRPEVEPEPAAADPRREVAVLIYTSGTTGVPKGVMLSHHNLLVSCRVTAELRRLTPEDEVYVVLPVSHIVGISLLISTLMFGATVRFAAKYDPAALVDAIRGGITMFSGVPATFQRLLDYAAASGEPIPRGRLRLISVAGAPLDPALKVRVEKAMGLPLLNGYGITECSPGISGVRMDNPRDDNSVGQILPDVEARVVRPDGRIVAPGEVGELHVRGENVMLGYYRAPDLTAKAIDPDGWFNTGDLVRFDGDVMFVVGRTKEMIIRSGFNVYPAEVEAVLAQHPAVALSAVVGRPVEGNEEIVAFVQLRHGAKATSSDLAAHCAAELTAYKRPTEIRIVEALPSTSTGKILKHKLAETARSTTG